VPPARFESGRRMGSTPDIVEWCNVLTAMTILSVESKKGGAYSPDLKVGVSTPKKGDAYATGAG